MRLICFWCAILAFANAQGGYYAPQTYRNNEVEEDGLFRPLHRSWTSMMRIPDRVDPSPTMFQPVYRPWNGMARIPNRARHVYRLVDPYHKELFSPAGRNDVTPQSSIAESWRPAPAPVHEPWREQANYAPLQPASILPRPESWRLPYPVSKEQQAAILHHKQALTKEGNFRFEYASDNGLAAGEVIEPDGSRVGAYQYKDPNGQLVKLKYRAGKDGFQILEGSHLPKSPEPLPPPVADNHYQQAYVEQRRQFELQQQYNQQRPEAQPWRENQGNEGIRDGRPAAAGGQYFVQSWRPGQEDDGQYRENEVESQNRGPHTFGEGYNFSFQG